MKGIKEAINQPHKHLYHKNRSIKDAKQLIEKGTYIGQAKSLKGKQATFHYINTRLNGELSYVVIKETKGNRVFYTITDNIKR